MATNVPSREDVTERELRVAGGLPTLFLLLLGFFGSIALIVVCGINGYEPLILLFVPTMIASLVCCIGLFSVQPNSTRVITLFGNYRGSVRTTGLHWANPFASKKAVS